MKRTRTSTRRRGRAGRAAAAIAMLSTAALALTGCMSGYEASTGAGGGGPAPAADGKVENGDEQSVRIAVFNGWDEGIAASHLWQQVLEEEGYRVELVPVDVAPGYSGLSTGDYDLILDTWLPITHASYIDEYGPKIEDLGSWNDEAKLTIVVNEDAPITSLDELAAHSADFGGALTGIEPGAGLTEVTQSKVIPGYGLEGMTYTTSSTAAMLSELKSATSSGRNVVATLWRPHWAYDAFPIRDLEDPKGLLGGAEGIHSFGAADLAETHPTLRSWITAFKMDSELLYSLENAMFGAGQQDDYTPAVQAWMAEHRDYVESLTP